VPEPFLGVFSVKRVSSFFEGPFGAAHFRQDVEGVGRCARELDLIDEETRTSILTAEHTFKKFCYLQKISFIVP